MLRTEAAQLYLLDNYAGSSQHRRQFASLVEQADSHWQELQQVAGGGLEEEAALQKLVGVLVDDAGNPSIAEYPSSFFVHTNACLLWWTW